MLLFFARGAAPIWRPAGGAAWGLALVVSAGLLFTWWARVTLGRLWSSGVERKADHRVIREGPYALVRHPIYTGIIFAAWATACLPATITSFSGALLFTLAYVIKARLEERFLREQLGDAAYRDYAREVPMLVPFTQRRPMSRPR